MQRIKKSSTKSRAGLKARPKKVYTAKRIPNSRVKKGKVVKYSPKSKALVRKQNIFIRLLKKPYITIPVGAALAVGAFFIINENMVPSLESIQESVVQIEVCNKNNFECGSGSGFAAYRDDYIVTNYHVIEGADTIKVRTIKGVEGKVTDVLAFDPVNDIAIVKWDRTLSPIRIGSSEDAKVGDKVLAIGNPLSETNVVSEGIISSKTSEHGLMTTAAISPGSSGGALILDSNHRVIGVTYLKLTAGESMNYAVRIEDVSKVHDKYNSGDLFKVNQNTSDSCHVTLAKIALDAKNLDFVGCRDSQGDVYSASSVGVFYDITNNRARFEHALNERSDWKLMYDRLSSSVKNLLVSNLGNTRSKAFDTNWKYAIWYMNENYYYSCQTSSCMVSRYINGFYPTANDGSASDGDLLEL